MTEPINVFWSGGFDSTYLVAKRLEQGYYVQPFVYNSCDDWQKHIREEAVRRFARDMMPRSFRRRLSGEIVYGWDEFIDGYVEHDNRMADLDLINRGQDVVLCSVAEELETIECGAVLDDRLHHTDHDLLEYKNDVGIRFPIDHISKRRIWEQSHGTWLRDVLSRTWACEADNGLSEPCGECYPCSVTIIPQEPLDWD